MMGSNSNYGNNNKGIMKAIQLQNNGHHYQAAQVFRREGNKERHPSEKQALWDAAKRAERIHNSD